MKKLFFLTGEKSGDMHAAKLFTEIKTLYPNVTALGLGGPHLKEAGVELIDDMTTLSTVGLVEPLMHVPSLLLLFLKIRKRLKEESPDMVIAVDNQGFNMPLIKYAKKIGLKTAYYISPQEWHWGTEKGGQAVANSVDHLIAIFKQEADFYTRLGGNVTYVGHPLIDTTEPTLTKSEFYDYYRLPEQTQLISVFPGSRLQEVKHVAPRLIRAAALIQRRYPDVKVVISIADDRYESIIRKHVKKAGIYNPLWYKDKSVNLIAHSYFSLLTSGTVTMEHALLGTPCVVAYVLNPVTFYFGKKVMMKRLGKLPFMSLPNLLEDQEIIPEFLQDNADPESLAFAVIPYMKSQSKYDEFRKSLHGFKDKIISQKGAVIRAAEVLVKELNKRGKL